MSIIAMKRIQSLDILRGATMALMVLVNNPGCWKTAWPPLLWCGYAPCR